MGDVIITEHGAKKTKTGALLFPGFERIQKIISQKKIKVHGSYRSLRKIKLFEECIYYFSIATLMNGMNAVNKHSNFT